MNNAQQRRGLGRGLGALIPTAPIEEEGTSEGVSAPAGAPAVQAAVADASATSNGSAALSGAPAATSNGSHGTNGVSAPSSAVGEPTGVAGISGAIPAGAYFAEIPLDQITPNRVNPRQVFEEEALAELVHSIKEIGLLQPIVVRKSGPGSYELIMGERRWRASRQAGLEAIPAIVRQTEDEDMLRDALLENLHRANLNPLEEAAAYQQLLDDFGCTHEQLAQRIGRSRPQISNTLRLLRLSPAVQRRVAAGVLSAGHARSLLAVEDSEVQDRLAQRVVAEGISVRALEEIVAVGDHGRGGNARSKTARPVAPGLADISERLSDRLETRVKVDLGKSKGKITVEFASLDDLRRIVDIMDPRNRHDRVI